MTGRSSPSRWRLRALSLAFVACVALSSCGLSGLEFSTPSAIKLARPANLATVTLPFTLTWTSTEPASGTDSGGEYAVFVDTTPMPPGKTVRYFARGDPSCEQTPGCPNASYLRNKNVYLTEQPRLVITGLADTRPTGRKSENDEHQITVILLGTGGRRVGESSYTVTVFVNRHASSSESSQ
jgi:hypothetical protein